jgi:hypothetical protein
VLSHRSIAFWMIFLTAMLAIGHLFASTGDPHALVSPGGSAEVADVHVHSHDEEAPTCGRVSLPALNACTPSDFASNAEAPGDAVPVPAADCRADTGDRPPPDLVAVLQVNRV